MDSLGNKYYAGRLDNYANAGALVDAYYLDWDILSYMQDQIPIMQSAIGTRHLMDGPLDFEINTALFVGAVTANPLGWAAAMGSAHPLMGLAHTTPYYQYGLMVNETSGWDIYGVNLLIGY